MQVLIGYGYFGTKKAKVSVISIINSQGCEQMLENIKKLVQEQKDLYNQKLKPL